MGLTVCASSNAWQLDANPACVGEGTKLELIEVTKGGVHPGHDCVAAVVALIIEVAAGAQIHTK